MIADAGISISPHGQPSDVVNSLASTLQRGRYPARTHVLMRAQTFSLNQIHARLLEAFSSVDLEPDTDMYEREQGMKELATETNP